VGLDVISTGMGDIKQQLALRLPEDMLEQVDERAKNLGISRNQWFENMTGWVLVNTHTVEARGGKP
jgi:metal-responsive CopG/Arc/MetJ family transcriptional regulator